MKCLEYFAIYLGSITNAWKYISIHFSYSSIQSNPALQQERNNNENVIIIINSNKVAHTLKKNCRIWFLRSTHDSKLTQNTTREVQEKKRKKELLFGWWENVGKERRWFSINLGPEERITPTQLSYTQWFWLGQGGFFNKINKSKRQNTWDLRLKTVVSFPFLGFLSNQTKNEASCAWRALAEKETPFP